MFTKSSIFLIFFINLINFCITTKWWIEENSDFNDPNNWENGNIPCSKDKIIFPKEFSAGIFLPNNLKTNGIIFPSDGSILFHANSKISFSNNKNDLKEKNLQCKNSNNLAKMKNIKNRNWFNIKNWKELPGVEQNPAIPHIERIPCSNEKVIIGLNGATSIDLDDVYQLYIGGIHLGHKDLTSDEFKLFLQSDIGQMIFKNAENTDIKYLNEPICGCHKIERVMMYQWKVCKYAKNICEIPKCVNPIVPTGHCCSICGSSLKLHIDNNYNCTQFNMNLFKKQLNKILKNEKDLSNQVYIDYRMVNDGDDKFLQLVIVDKNEYNENSVKLMNILKETLLKLDYYNNVRATFHMSGMPYNPGQNSSGWIIMLLTLLGVLTFFIILITYYMPEQSPISLPTWIYPSRYQHVFNSPFVFARFDNNQPDVEISGGSNVTNNPNDENLAASGVIGGIQEGTTSFNNPMFEENAEKQTCEGGPLENEMSEIVLDENKSE